MYYRIYVNDMDCGIYKGGNLYRALENMAEDIGGITADEIDYTKYENVSSELYCQVEDDLKHLTNAELADLWNEKMAKHDYYPYVFASSGQTFDDDLKYALKILSMDASLIDENNFTPIDDNFFYISNYAIYGMESLKDLGEQYDAFIETVIDDDYCYTKR